MKKAIFKKSISMLLVIAMVIPTLLFTPIAAFASGESSSESVYSEQSSSQSTYLDGVYYHITKNIIYSGNNSYQLAIDLQTSLTGQDKAITRSSSADGYFTVETAGYYLIELWGGKGSNGGDASYFFGASVNPGGEGGAAGYVYAKVYLEAGQTLAYTVGTNGAPTTRDDSGGGQNGEGGEHGETGSYMIGGGGGYSALYFFDEGEFDTSWMSASGSLRIPNTARVSRYVMIAAGGGGGGAGNGPGQGSSNTADGGSGGNINNGPSLTLSGKDYAVEGYIFSGKNGKTSGISTSYVGKGGTNVPGSSPKTVGGDYVADPGPNDWSGSYNLDTDPGAGGTGNLRGGGGGAGYCGGSGGIMYSLILASEVGGGGGGSSFLAKKFGDNSVQFADAIDAETKALLSGAYACPSSVGGAFSYTYLGDGEESSVVDTKYLTSVLVEGEFSKYFDVVDAFAIDANGNENGVLNFSNDDGKFTVASANIDASTSTITGSLLSINFILKAKSGFAGGNKVPLLNGLAATVAKIEGEPQVITADKTVNTDEVNVPLNFPIITNSKMTSLKDEGETVSYPLTDLYSADYASVITAIKNGAEVGWQYDFITSLSDYKIYEGKEGASGTEITSGSTPELSETAYYSVVLNATADESLGYADVGPRIVGEQTFVGIACVAIVSSDIFSWEYDITANKYLSYNGSAYVFEEKVQQSVTSTYSDSAYYTNSTSSSYIENTFTATQGGYYLLQAWGASGGAGGYGRSAARYSGTTYTNTGSGGAGGAGASVYGFVYLEAGDTLTMRIGKSGSAGSNVNNGYGYNGNTTTQKTFGAAGYAGTGGGYAAFSITKNGEDTSTPILIASGGGGGGGGSSGTTATNIGSDKAKGGDGSSGSTALSSSYLGSLASYAGSSGTRGSVSIGTGLLQLPTAVAGKGGSAVTSYYDSSIVNVGENDGETIYIKRLADTMIADGAVTTSTGTANASAQITYICTPLTTDTLNKFPSVYTSGSFSEYFEIESLEDGTPAIEMLFDGITPDSKTVEVDGDTTTVTYYTKNIVMAEFSYVLTENGDGTLSFDITNTLYYPTFEISETTANGYVANSGFSLRFLLNPKEGFLGGNDVPVIPESGDGYSSITISQAGYTGKLSADPSVDYANVAIDYDLAADFTVKNGSVILGDDDLTNDSVMISDLYTLKTDFSSFEPWQTRFVELLPPEEKTVSPTKTETVGFTASILPTVRTPEKALVIGATDGISATLAATVYVNYFVNYTLTNMKHSGELLALYGRDFKTTLSAADGYELPPLQKGEKIYVTVKVGGEEITITTSEYNEKTGELTIPAEFVTAPIEIIAIARDVEYTIHYIYTLDGEDEAIEYNDSYVAGEIIDYTWFDSLNATIPEVVGYDFFWDFDTEDGNQPVTMPANDVWAIGSYQKEMHLLVINYVDSNGQELAPSYSQVVEYESEYRVSSPLIDDYLASSATVNGASVDPFVVSGVMGTEDITVTVKYTYANNKLVILYLDSKDNEIAPRVEKTFTENSTYNELTPNVVGYTPDPLYAGGVSGVMSGTQSVVVKVYYTANKYEVNFEYAYDGIEYLGEKIEGAGLDYDFTDAYMDVGGQFLIEYDNVYSYNAALGEYGLPTPIVLGYVFGGWYSDASLTNEVTEATPVNTLEAVTLYAKWTPQEFKITISYSFEFEDGDFLPDYSLLSNGTLYKENGGYYYYQQSYYVGQSYNLPIGNVTGYTAYSDYGMTSNPTAVEYISGTMPSSNLMFYITYEINTYTVNFTDLLGENISYPDYTSVDKEGFDTHWQTIYVKHGAIPVYTLDQPTHAFDANIDDPRLVSYSYFFTGWKNASTGIKYGTEQSLAAVTSDVDYYACYDAKENIAVVIVGGAIENYYSSLGEAFEYAISVGSTYDSSAPTVQLRRNSDVDDKVIDLRETDNGETVVVNYSSNYYVDFDLNSYTVYSDNTVFENHLYLTILDSVGGGEIVAESGGDVVAIKHLSATLMFGDGIGQYGATVRAVSQNGNATAIESNALLYVYAGNAEAESGSGNACAVNSTYAYNSSYTYIYEATVSATSNSGDAYAVNCRNSVTVNNNANVVAESGSGDSYGIYSNRDITFNSSGAYVAARSTDGNAFAVYAVEDIDAARVSADNQIELYARSENKNATALYGKYVYSGIYANALAEAPGGHAIAIDCGAYANYNVGASGYNYVIKAVGKRATAIKYSYHLYLYATVIAEATDTAIGITNSLYNTYLQSGASVTATTASGTAYAIKDAQLVAYNTTGESCSVSASATSGKAYALYDVGTVNNYGSITAIATVTTGTAYGAAFDLKGDRSLDSTLTVVATSTDGGSAYGVWSNHNATVACSVEAYGKYAYGAYSNSGTLTVTSAARVRATGSVGAGKVYGAYIAPSANMTLAASSTVSADGIGEVYGVYNNGTVSEIGSTVNVTSISNAYGVYNLSSILKTVDGFKVTVTSSGANAYGIFAASGSVGAAGLQSSISNGVIHANTQSDGSYGFAFYSAGGYIYIRGANLYFKGSSDDVAIYGDGVVICNGYYTNLLPADHAVYPSYYILETREYTITFIQVDLNGIEAENGRTVVSYTPETTFVNEPAFIYNFTGYTVSWESYDFSAPESGTNKNVYCVYTANTYTITFVTNGGSAIDSASYKYLDNIVAPTDPTMYGYIFEGWYTDSSLTDKFIFATMPASDITLYAKYTAGTYTITFVTNGGTEVAPITAQYGTYVYLPESVKPGYYLDAWYYDEALTRYFASGGVSMPGQDITVYAKWSASMSLVILGAPKEYTVRLNLMLDLDGDGANDYLELYLAGGTLSFEDLSDIVGVAYLPGEAFPDGMTRLLLGWFSSETPSVDTAIDITSGVGSWGIKPINGVVNIYAGWKAIPNASSVFDFNGSQSQQDGYSQAMFNTMDLNGTDLGDVYSNRSGILGIATVDPMHHNGVSYDDGYVYLLYKVIVGGEYNFHYINFIQGDSFPGNVLNLNVTVYGSDSTVREICNKTVEGKTTLSLGDMDGIRIDANDGDIIAIRLNTTPGVEKDASNAPILYSILVLPDLSGFSDMDAYDYFVIHNAVDFLFYTVEMGSVALAPSPVEDFLGWTWLENGSPNGTIVTHMSTAMYDKPNAWTSFEGLSTLILVEVTGGGGEIEIEWIGAIVPDRYHNPDVFDDLKINATISAHGSVSFAFAAESGLPYGTLATLEFSAGLPVGATITFIDLSGNYPVYYYYLVSDEGIKSIALTEFTVMGGTKKFSGMTDIMMFNISYAQCEHSLTQETVTIALNGEEIGLPLSYSIKHTNESSIGSATFEYDDTLTGIIPLPSLSGKGYASNDKVVLVMSLTDLDGNRLPMPTAMEFKTSGATIYTYGDFAYIEIGYVYYFTSSSSVRGEVALNALRYLRFSGYLIYEIMVVPADYDLTGMSYNGADTVVDTRYKFGLTVIDPPLISLEESKGEVNAGGSVDLPVTVGDGSEQFEISLYLYQLQGGKLVKTDDCSSLLSDFTVDGGGLATAVSGEDLVSGNITLNISDGASDGVYYLVFYHVDDYAVYALTVK